MRDLGGVEALLLLFKRCRVCTSGVSLACLLSCDSRAKLQTDHGSTRRAAVSLCAVLPVLMMTLFDAS